MYSVSNYEHTMSKVYREVILNFSAKQMFELVNDVDEYPKFLPYCSEAGLAKDLGQCVGEYYLKFSYAGFEYMVETRNAFEPNKFIDINLIKGPFSSLEGRWVFDQINDHQSKVSFEVDYQLSFGLEYVLGSVVRMAMSEAVNVYCRRAIEVYGHD